MFHKRSKIKRHHLWRHETKKNVLGKFLLLLVILASYFIFVACKYGMQEGLAVTILTWSFFVLCTPVADAGFLLAFPLRLTTGIPMLTSQIFVSLSAVIINFFAFFFAPDIYNRTALLNFFKHILDQPIPFWAIILLSTLGTFASIIFGDEMLDKIKHSEREIYQRHKNKHRYIVIVFLFVATFILYDFLLQKMNINIPL